jgi:tetratricopeptide (TPR) repeat protein
LDRGTLWGVSLLLAVLVAIAFGETLGHGFVNYDDFAYVYENPSVIGGITARGLISAFTESDLYLWNPLTRISHMFSCHLFGLQPWGHHLVNVVLHGATAVFLFLALVRLTGAVWQSAFVAALFAIHPLRVESVAWVSERKDVLSGLFFVLILCAYERYVRKPRSLGRYLGVLVLFALGLLAKQILITLPFVLLLLDYWPLNRFADYTRPGDRLSGVILEKVPFFVLAAASAGQILFDPFGWNGNPPPILQAPLAMRLGNAALSYVLYLWQLVFPVNLAVPYPFPNEVALWKLALALALLGGITLWAYWLRKKCPFLAVGWCWYVGMLLPVIGVVGLGAEARCDRYTYLPHIGIYIMITWGIDRLGRSSRRRHVFGIAGATLSIALLISLTQKQASYWKESETLWRHTIACTERNVIAESNLASALVEKGKMQEAAVHFAEALKLNPRFHNALVGFGYLALQTGEPDKAAGLYRAALRVQPGNVKTYNNLGNALLRGGKKDEAAEIWQTGLGIEPGNPKLHANLGRFFLESDRAPEALFHFQKVVDAHPENWEARLDLGSAFLENNQPEQALAQSKKALAIRPGNAGAHAQLASACSQLGRLKEAVAHYQRALEIDPKLSPAQNGLAWILATSEEAALRNGNYSAALAESALTLSKGEQPAIFRTLAAAYAEAKRFPQAVEVINAVLQAGGEPAFTALLQRDRALYEAGMPLRMPGPRPTPD